METDSPETERAAFLSMHTGYWFFGNVKKHSQQVELPMVASVGLFYRKYERIRGLYQCGLPVFVGEPVLDEN